MVSLENEDFEFDVCKDDGDEFCKSNYEDEKCCCTETLCCEDNEAKNKHGISILMNVNSNDAGIIRDALIEAGHIKVADDFETRRELGIMHEIKENGWVGIFEKWSKDTYGCTSNRKRQRYKMKHKILAK